MKIFPDFMAPPDKRLGGAFLFVTTFRTKNDHLETGGLFLGMQGQ
jgi:hypothetical protein